MSGASPTAVESSPSDPHAAANKATTARRMSNLFRIAVILSSPPLCARTTDWRGMTLPDPAEPVRVAGAIPFDLTPVDAVEVMHTSLDAHSA